MNDFIKDYAIYIAIAVIVIAVVIVILMRRRKGASEASQLSDSMQADVTSEGNIEAVEQHELSTMVCFNTIESLSSFDENRLVEIKDKQLLNRIDGVIPGTMQAVVNSAALMNYSKSASQLYKVIIPAGEELTKSLDMEGAVRAFSQDSKGRVKHVANLVAVDDTASQKLAAANTMNAVMGIASMVVGQYYMTQINSQLDKVSDQLKNIESFQENEFKGKIFALIASIQKCSTFQYEVLQDNDVRNRELIHLKTLEHECAELLGQVNITLQNEAKLNNIKYDEYERKVSAVQEWLEYQRILLNLMGKIGDLTYALNLGAITKGNAFAMCEPYAKQSSEAQRQLLIWHQIISNNLA